MTSERVLEWIERYARLRRRFNPLDLPDEPQWESVKNYSIEKFGNWINSFPYKKDGLWGLIDLTDDPDDFSDRSKRSFRDCDDFARMWSLWGLYNNFSATEYIVTTKENPVKDAHVVTVLGKEGKYVLCNYNVYPSGEKFSSENKAIDYMKTWKRYSKSFITFRYEHWSSLPEKGE